MLFEVQCSTAKNKFLFLELNTLQTQMQGDARVAHHNQAQPSLLMCTWQEGVSLQQSVTLVVSRANEEHVIADTAAFSSPPRVTTSHSSWIVKAGGKCVYGQGCLASRLFCEATKTAVAQRYAPHSKLNRSAFAGIVSLASSRPLLGSGIEKELASEAVQRQATC